jgi:hypothetical protein
MQSSTATRRPGGWALAISDALTVGDLVRLAPATISVLADRGLASGRDDEGGGGEAPTLADVARCHRVALDTLLEELRDAAAEDAAHAARYELLGG